MAGPLLEWYGDRVLDLILRGAARATGETAEAAAADAAAQTPVLTGAARASLSVEPVEVSGVVISVRWGYHVRYGIYIEIGDRGRPGHHALRGAGDRNYGSLPGRIKAAAR